MKIELTILGEPVQYKRERINMRAVSRWMAVKMRGNPYRFGPLTYTPGECKTWQRQIQKAIPSDTPMLQGKISLWVTWYRAKPWTDSINKLRPDGDNVLKNLKDALQGPLYIDDAYVSDEHVIQIFDAPVPMLRVKLSDVQQLPNVKLCIAPGYKRLTKKSANTTPKSRANQP